jgi:hypothetical protein
MRCNMNFLNKMERKIGKYAIPNLMIYLIAAYCIGFVIYTVNPNFMLMLTLSPYHILHGQVWRLITWILMPTDTRVFSLLIMALLYYQLGSALERSWGTFRFNVYIFGGMLFTVIGAFILYGIYAAAGTGSLETISLISSLTFTTNYINLTIFLAFAVMYPEMQILLFFIIPVKMKWMAVVYAVLIAINLILTSWGGRIAIIMSILNFLTIFVIAIALGAETEFQVWIIQFSPSADCTFMLCHHTASPRLPHLSLKYLLPVNFLRGYPSVISGRQIAIN